MEGNPQKELQTMLDYLEKISNEDPEILKKKVYETFSGVAFLALEAKDAKYKKGWASKLVDRHGDPLFGKKEAEILESAAKTFVEPMFRQAQNGGEPDLKPSSTMSMIQQKNPINPDDISIDKAFWKVRELFSTIDKNVKTFSRELGPFRFFYDRQMDFRIPLPIPMPAPPFIAVVMVPIPPRAIPILIGLIVESIRLTYSVGPLSNDTTRKTLSLVLGLIDILKGDWKQGILSILGFFGEAPLLAGVFMKVVVNLMEFIAPDIQEKLILDLYQSGKSLFIGFLLWGFANFSPDVARAIAREQFDKIKQVVTDANGKIDEVQAAMQKSIDPLGLKIKFQDISDDFIPSFDDIQNIQAIIRQPTIFCSKEFQETIEPMRKLPVIRLVLELMSIPTDTESLEAACKDQAGVSLEATLGKALEPKITPGPGSPLLRLED
jgi:hypothetical protein